MARPLRLEYPGAWWHVLSRGVDREDIFLSDKDRRRFLRLLAVAIPHFRWRLHAYVLMSNHYHLLIETIEPTLSRGMKKIGGDYAIWFNKRHRRVGHLFQARFRAHLIDSDEYLLTVARYVVLNPVRAHIVDDALQWPWSSARATAGCAVVPPWLTTDAILGRLQPHDSRAARQLYRAFVHDVASAKSPWRNLVGQTYLGGATFIDQVQHRIDARVCSDEHPRAQRVVRCAAIADVRSALHGVTGEFPTKSGAPAVRLAYALLAYSEALLPLREVGAALGIGAAGAWRAIRRAQKREQSDRCFAELLEQVRMKITKSKVNT
ncbi:MAG TPA: transposase [Thermoanaerobaculia bacterium]|nr:transposase [Thermoanaerobaculia bacterium]